MKSFESEIKRIAGKTRLKAMEREAIRERVLSYMEYHPLKKDHIDIESLSALKGEDFTYISWSSLWVRVASGAFALLLVVGVPLLAERSVPGDMLYLVKTGVNEGIRTQLATTPYEKVELETALMERRIAEARLLASEGKLTTEVEAQIVETVKGHAAAVQSELAELRESDVDGAAIAEIVFSTTLEVQSAVLNESDNNGSSSVSSLISAVDTVLNDVASDENPVAPSYDGLLARIELETTRSYELFESVKEDATNEEIVDIERRLADINRSIVSAREQKELDETGTVNSLTSVLGLIQKLITFMTDIDVREHVALETLVPVVLTPEEQSTLVTNRLTQISTGMEMIDMRIASITDDSLHEKLMNAREHVHGLVASTTESVSVGEFHTALEQSSEAEKALNDIVTLLDAQEESVAPEIPSTTSPVDSVSTTTSDGSLQENGTTTPSSDEGEVLEDPVIE